MAAACLQWPSKPSNESHMTIGMCKTMGSALLALLLSACMSTSALQQYTDIAKPERDKRAEDALRQQFASHTFRSTQNITLNYRLLAPNTAKNAQTRYPLVLFMHGSGEIGNDNQKHLWTFPLRWAESDMRQRYPAYVLVPQVPSRSVNYDKKQAYSISYATPTLTSVLELVDDITSRYPIDPDRIYVAGFSMGGSAAWQSVLLRPELFAAASPFSGVAPDRYFAERYLHTPILVTHGGNDNVTLPVSSELMTTRIQQLGGKQITMRFYPELGHAVPNDIIYENWWWDWLFSHKRNLVQKQQN